MIIRTEGRLVAMLLVALVFVPAASADALPKFTGYTRLGSPPTDEEGKKVEKDVPKEAPKEEKEGKEKPATAVADRDEKVIGVTIYYMVLDRKEGKKGKKGDTWGIGLDGFDTTFVPGRNSDPGELDTTSRYLYLYQIVNDRPGTEAAIKDLSIRLLVDSRLVTSFGWFRQRDRDKGETRGLGFSMEFPNPKKDANNPTMILPISTLHPGVGLRGYQNPAPARQSPKLYGIAPIAIGKVREVSDDSEVGRAPEDVLLLPAVNFGSTNEPDPIYLKPALLSDSEKLPGMEDSEARRRMRDRYRKTWPAVRAFWREADNQIKPRQRSTIFGFTCDFPPTLDAVSVGGRALGIGWGKNDCVAPADRALVFGKRDKVEADVKGDFLLAGAAAIDRILKQRGEAGAVLPAISGTLPTPTQVPPGALARPTMASRDEPSRGGFAGPPPDIGGGGGRGGSTGTAGGSGGGRGGIAFGGGGGGGSGSGSGGGGSDGGSAQPEQPEQPEQETVVTVNNTTTTTVSSTGKATAGSGSGASAASGSNQAGTLDGNVLPAPPAWILGLLGVPAFWLMTRRKKARKSA